jgi:hypothetical protein
MSATLEKTFECLIIIAQHSYYQLSLLVRHRISYHQNRNVELLTRQWYYYAGDPLLRFRRRSRRRRPSDLQQDRKAPAAEPPATAVASVTTIASHRKVAKQIRSCATIV